MASNLNLLPSRCHHHHPRLRNYLPSALVQQHTSNRGLYKSSTLHKTKTVTAPIRSFTLKTKPKTDTTQQPMPASPAFASESSSASSSSSLFAPDYDPADPIFSVPDPYVVHTIPRLSAMEKKYSWVDWDRFADYIHRSDMMFFDNEVKNVSEWFDVTPNEELYQKLNDESLRTGPRQEELKTFLNLLPYGMVADTGTVAHTTRYGKVRSLWIMLVAGDQAGTATFGIGRGNTYGEAFERAQFDCMKNVTFLPLIESRTVLYRIQGRFGGCVVDIRPTPRGAGIVSGALMKHVLQRWGVQDITVKVVGRAIAKHQVLALWEGFSHQRSLRQLSIARGLNAHKMFERGVQQPRCPPRAVLRERAEEIHRKLKESQVLIMDQQKKGLKEEDTEQLAQHLYEDLHPPPPPQPVPGADTPEGGEYPEGIDNDDVIAAEDWAEAEDRDRAHWGPWAKAPQYIPASPGRKPYIPPPLPANHYGQTFKSKAIFRKRQR